MAVVHWRGVIFEDEVAVVVIGGIVVARRCVVGVVVAITGWIVVGFDVTIYILQIIGIVHWNSAIEGTDKLVFVFGGTKHKLVLVFVNLGYTIFVLGVDNLVVEIVVVGRETVHESRLIIEVVPTLRRGLEENAYLVALLLIADNLHVTLHILAYRRTANEANANIAARTVRQCGCIVIHLHVAEDDGLIETVGHLAKVAGEFVVFQESLHGIVAKHIFHAAAYLALVEEHRRKVVHVVQFLRHSFDDIGAYREINCHKHRSRNLLLVAVVIQFARGNKLHWVHIDIGADSTFAIYVAQIVLEHNIIGGVTAVAQTTWRCLSVLLGLGVVGESTVDDKYLLIRYIVLVSHEYRIEILILFVIEEASVQASAFLVCHLLRNREQDRIRIDCTLEYERHDGGITLLLYDGITIELDTRRSTIERIFAVKLKLRAYEEVLLLRHATDTKRNSHFRSFGCCIELDKSDFHRVEVEVRLVFVVVLILILTAYRLEITLVAELY